MRRQHVEFDQGWSVTITHHSYGCTLEWERRGSLDAHLTDLLPNEVHELVAALNAGRVFL